MAQQALAVCCRSTAKLPVPFRTHGLHLQVARLLVLQSRQPDFRSNLFAFSRGDHGGPVLLHGLLLAQSD